MTEPTPPTPGDDGDAQRIIFAITAALLVLVVTYKVGQSDAPVQAPVEVAADAAFSPPAESTIPAGPDGDAIRRGRLIFTASAAHAGQYVGNGLTCSNCHLDAGRKADASPMWAAWVSYPAYRAKNGRYAQSVADLKPIAVGAKLAFDEALTPRLQTTPEGYVATLPAPANGKGGASWHIRQDARLWRE